jgi:toxin-antitoxin system PIN domain toxin
VKLIDANVLVYAVNESDPKHTDAAAWLDDALSGSEQVGFASVVLLAFLRLSTRVGLFPHPLSVDEGLERVRRWIEQPNAVLLEPTSRHLDILSGLLSELGAGGNLVGDAHLAALAIEHHATIISFDNDFGRFRGVRWSLPAPSGHS